MISRALFIGLYVFISAACGTNTIEKSPEPTTALDHTLSPAEPKPRESNDEVSKPTKQAAVKPIGKESKDLKKDTGSSVVTGPSDTLITPVLESKIEKGKNSVYCSTFQLAWNTLNELVGDSIKLEGDPPLVHKLNSSKITESDIAPEDYLAMAGYNRDRIVEKINRHLIDKFSGDAPKLKIELTTDDDILAYSFLNKRLQFKTKFESLRAPVRFESGGAFTSVEAFGITQYFRRKHRKMGRQVRVVDYLSDNDFIVTLKTIAKNDEIILAKISPKETLRKTVESVLDRLEKSKPESLKEEDILMIPLVDLKIDHSYEELIGLGIKNEGFQGGILGEALQTIDFHLNEEGALLKSQSIITVELNGDPYKKLVFDKAFLILLKQKKSKNPYLSIWIDNPALFREKKKEARSAFSDTTTFD